MLRSPRKDGKITVIMNEYRRTASLARRLSAIARQSEDVVSNVWVCMFFQPKQKWLERLLRGARAGSRIRFDYFLSSYDLKYFGRFQLALQAPTEFVYIVDDDIIPAPGYLPYCVSQIRSLGGAIGTYGWRYTNERRGHYREGNWIESFQPGNSVPHPVKTDFLCCHHFVRTEWIKYLWYEDPLSFETGEDMHFGINLAACGNIECFVVPTNMDRLEYVIDDEQGVPGTTRGAMIALRNEIFQALRNRRVS